MKEKLCHQNDSTDLLEFKDCLNSCSGQGHASTSSSKDIMSRLVSVQDTAERPEYNRCFYNWEVSQHNNDLLDVQKCLEVTISKMILIIDSR